MILASRYRGPANHGRRLNRLPTKASQVTVLAEEVERVRIAEVKA